jgi:hypothetical protein
MTIIFMVVVEPAAPGYVLVCVYSWNSKLREKGHEAILEPELWIK